jgi:hypothetical protein
MAPKYYCVVLKPPSQNQWNGQKNTVEVEQIDWCWAVHVAA